MTQGFLDSDLGVTRIAVARFFLKLVLQGVYGTLSLRRLSRTLRTQR
jgi:hypothetical protein